MKKMQGSDIKFSNVSFVKKYFQLFERLEKVA